MPVGKCITYNQGNWWFWMILSILTHFVLFVLLPMHGPGYYQGLDVTKCLLFPVESTAELMQKVIRTLYILLKSFGQGCRILETNGNLEVDQQLHNKYLTAYFLDSVPFILIQQFDLQSHWQLQIVPRCECESENLFAPLCWQCDKLVTCPGCVPWDKQW